MKNDKMHEYAETTGQRAIRKLKISIIFILLMVLINIPIVMFKNSGIIDTIVGNQGDQSGALTAGIISGILAFVWYGFFFFLIKYYIKKWNSKLIKKHEKKNKAKIFLTNQKESDHIVKSELKSELLNQKEKTEKNLSGTIDTEAIIFCRKCGKIIPGDSEFCQYCGNKIKVFENVKLNHEGSIPEDVNISLEYDSIEKAEQVDVSKNHNHRKILLTILVSCLILAITVVICIYILSDTNSLKQFDYSLELGTNTYITVNSIEPVYGLHPLGGKNTSIICNCTGLNGEKYLMHIKLDDYHQYFDSTAEIDYNDNTKFDIIKYNQYAIIYGFVDNVGEVTNGLVFKENLNSDRKLLNYLSVDIVDGQEATIHITTEPDYTDNTTTTEFYSVVETTSNYNYTTANIQPTEYVTNLESTENESFNTLVYEGIGSSTIKGINVPYGSYYITCEYLGEHNFTVYFYDDISNSTYDYEMIANEVGVCTTTYGFTGSVNDGYINVQNAVGSWKITIEKCVVDNSGTVEKEYKFHGNGSSSVKNINLPVGKYYITLKYYGEHNFNAYFYKNAEGGYYNSEMIANEIGQSNITYGFFDSVENGYINIKCSGEWEMIIEPS